MMMKRYPNLKKEVGGSIPNCEISSLLDKKKLAKWSVASCALALACRSSVSKKQQQQQQQQQKNLRDIIGQEDFVCEMGLHVYMLCRLYKVPKVFQMRFQLIQKLTNYMEMPCTRSS
jgi:hypothetical protein